MRKSWFVIALLSLTTALKSQTNFTDAVVINANGDSLKGKIDYRNWKMNPQTVSFINSLNEKKIYNPTSIAGFYLQAANEIYKSFTIQMDMLPGDEFKAINDGFVDSPSVKKTVFLLQLIRSPALELYQFTDSYKDHLYYVKENQSPVELIHHYFYNEQSKKLEEDETYKNQLLNLVADCPDVASLSKRIKFSKDEIQNIFLKYIQYNSPNTAIEIKKKDPIIVRVGVVAGLMVNKFKFTGSNIYLVDDNYSGNTSPLAGASIDIGLSRNQHKWHIVNELIYKSYATSNSFTRPYGIVYTVKSDVDVKFSYLQLNTFLRYIFKTGSSLNPYINFGLGNAFMVTENKNSLHNIYSFGREENVKAFDGPKKYEPSVMGGAGLSVKKIQIEFRYASSQKGFSPYNAVDVNTSSVQLLFTYQF
ncbi:MAG TPA: outer membrane beta-barrel protein [Panacibacter sp.]|nr:outer membrane beta-barrel protein [Panacibacter sp.]